MLPCGHTYRIAYTLHVKEARTADAFGGRLLRQPRNVTEAHRFFIFLSA